MHLAENFYIQNDETIFHNHDYVWLLALFNLLIFSFSRTFFWESINLSDSSAGDSSLAESIQFVREMMRNLGRSLLQKEKYPQPPGNQQFKSVCIPLIKYKDILIVVRTCINDNVGDYRAEVPSLIEQIHSNHWWTKIVGIPSTKVTPPHLLRHLTLAVT